MCKQKKGKASFLMLIERMFNGLASNAQIDRLSSSSIICINVLIFSFINRSSTRQV